MVTFRWPAADLDGAKVGANAFRPKAMSQAGLTGKQKVLADEISALMEEAKTVNVDEDARTMKTADGFYHDSCSAQGVVDADDVVIVATALNNTPNDILQRHPSTRPIIEHTVDTAGAMPKTWSADTGYCSAANLAGRSKTLNPPKTPSSSLPPDA